MFDVEQSWKMDEPEKVVAIIKEVGVWRLANWDGCICSRFSIRNVDVDISCGKGSDRGIRIDSPSMDYWNEDTADDCDEKLLRPIAEEVKRQIENGGDHRGPIPIFIGKAKAVS